MGLVVSLLHFAEWIFFFRVCVRCLESGLAWRQGTKILDVGGRGFFTFGVDVFGLFGFRLVDGVCRGLALVQAFLSFLSFFSLFFFSFSLALSLINVCFCYCCCFSSSCLIGSYWDKCGGQQWRRVSVLELGDHNSPAKQCVLEHRISTSYTSLYSIVNLWAFPSFQVRPQNFTKIVYLIN